MKSLHHSFDIELAEEYGIVEAVLIHHFQHWITVNKKLKKNHKEGKTWTYQTLEEIAAHYPYFTRDQVRDVLYKLENGKSRKGKSEKLLFNPVFLTGNFNKHKYDKTQWYAFVDEYRFISSDESPHGVGESPHGKGRIPTPIPDTKTHTETLKESINTKESLSSEESPASSEALASTDAHSSPSSNKKIERDKYVFTTEIEHERLAEKYSVKTRDDCYKLLSEWKQDTPRSKWKK
ncbi:MAG: hypothetical protein ACTSQE_16255, partial [Candidatus Heimdallarchaeaceae archaeon]